MPNTGEIDVAVLNTAAPNTGMFVGDSEFSKFGGVIVTAIMIAMGLAGTMVYGNRKTLLHKVNFKKNSL